MWLLVWVNEVGNGRSHGETSGVGYAVVSARIVADAIDPSADCAEPARADFDPLRELSHYHKLLALARSTGVRPQPNSIPIARDASERGL